MFKDIEMADSRVNKSIPEYRAALSGINERLKQLLQTSSEDYSDTNYFADIDLLSKNFNDQIEMAYNKTINNKVATECIQRTLKDNPDFRQMYWIEDEKEKQIRNNTNKREKFRAKAIELLKSMALADSDSKMREVWKNFEPSPAPEAFKKNILKSYLGLGDTDEETLDDVEEFSDHYTTFIIALLETASDLDKATKGRIIQRLPKVHAINKEFTFFLIQEFLTSNKLDFPAATDAEKQNLLDKVIDITFTHFSNSVALKYNTIKSYLMIVTKIFETLDTPVKEASAKAKRYLFEKLNKKWPLKYPDENSDPDDRVYFLALMAAMARADGRESVSFPHLDPGEQNYLNDLKSRINLGDTDIFNEGFNFLTFAQAEFQQLLGLLPNKDKERLIYWCSYLAQGDKNISDEEQFTLEKLIKNSNFERTSLAKNTFDAIMKSYKCQDNKSIITFPSSETTSIDERLKFLSLAISVAIKNDKTVGHKESKHIIELRKKLRINSIEALGIKQSINKPVKEVIKDIDPKYRPALLAEIYFLALKDLAHSLEEMAWLQSVWEAADISKDIWTEMRKVFEFIKSHIVTGDESKCATYLLHGALHLQPELPEDLNIQQKAAFITLASKIVGTNENANKMLMDLAGFLNLPAFAVFLCKYNNNKDFWNNFTRWKISDPNIESIVKEISPEFHVALLFELVKMAQASADGYIGSEKSFYLSALNATKYIDAGWDFEFTLLCRHFLTCKGSLPRRYSVD
jgi:hypothetical protein